MKSFLFVIIIGCFLACLSGCQQRSDTAPTTSSSNHQQQDTTIIKSKASTVTTQVQ